MNFWNHSGFIFSISNETEVYRSVAQLQIVDYSTKVYWPSQDLFYTGTTYLHVSEITTEYIHQHKKRNKYTQNVKDLFFTKYITYIS